MSQPTRLLLHCAAFFLTASTAIAQSPTPKPPLTGIVSMGSIWFHRVDGGIPDNSIKSIEARPGLLDGVVINISWAQLQPKPGTLDTTALDDALKSVRAYNRSYPAKPMRVLLRMWPGPVAPKWAKNIGGPPITILHRDMKITVGRFWSPEYRAAWRALQDQLGAKYDSDPLIASISNVSGSSITDEPLLIAGDADLSIKNLRDAGFTDAAYKQTLIDSVDDYRAWKTTNIEQTFSPYRELDSGRPQLKESVTIELMKRWHEQMGPRGVISNHALDGPPQERLVFIYDTALKLGQPIEYQRVAPKTLRNDEAVTYAIAHGATMVELWSGNSQFLDAFENQSPADLKRWSAELKANVKK